jgi:catechol 2,3-dioxygenase-like lactoylglutathione lyase family enzyme
MSTAPSSMAAIERVRTILPCARAHASAPRILPGRLRTLRSGLTESRVGGEAGQLDCEMGAVLPRESAALLRYADDMRVCAIDHLVLCVRDVAVTRQFYERVLGMESREERPGKWSLHFGVNKISLQSARSAPSIARDTVPGSGNFCVLTDIPMNEVIAHLAREGVALVDGPGERAGATGAILSVYFKDPDGNLVEVSNQL